MATSRIPRKISDFNDYIRNTDTYLHSPSPSGPVVNWMRLGLTEENAEAWQDNRNAWDVLYAKYIDPNTKTKIVTAQVSEGMDAFRTFAQPLLDIMAVNPNALTQDAVTFNFKIGRSKPTYLSMPIAEQCYVNLTSIGGAMIKFACRTEQQDRRRAALPHEADSVMLAYKIGDEVPVTPNSSTEVKIITRASDMTDMGIENRGKRLYLFARWYNTRYPEFAGPWSEMTSISL